MILTHPTLPRVTRDIPDSAAQDWIASGWLAPEPALPTLSPTPVPESAPEVDAPARPASPRKKV